MLVGTASGCTVRQGGAHRGPGADRASLCSHRLGVLEGSVRAHRLDLHGRIPETPLGAAHRGSHPVPARHPSCRQLTLNSRHLAPSGGPDAAARAHGPGVWSGPAITERAVSHPARLRAPPVPCPFAAAGRAVPCQDRTVHPYSPTRLGLRAVRRPGGLDRHGPRACAASGASAANGRPTNRTPPPPSPSASAGRRTPGTTADRPRGHPGA